MGQLLFLRAGGGGNPQPGDQSLQSAYDGGRDMLLQYGPARLIVDSVDGFVDGESALVIGSNTTARDLSMLTLAKSFPSGDVPARNPVLAIGNLGSEAPAIQTFGTPTLNPGSPIDISDANTDVVGLDVVFGGPNEGHHTEYGTRGIQWRRWMTGEDGADTPFPGPVARLHLNFLRESGENAIDPEHLDLQDRTTLQLKLGSSASAAVARYKRFTLEGVDGTNTLFEIEHGLLAFGLLVQVFEIYSGDLGLTTRSVPGVRTYQHNLHAITLSFDDPPDSNSEYLVVVVGY